jgi:uncharacterized repeat protein (TIGR02543 family)
MTKKLLLSIAGIILAVACLFVACPNEPDPGPSTTPAPTKYTVSFDKNGGDTEASPKTKDVIAPAKTVGTLPTAPTRTGYTFAGWYSVSAASGGTQFLADTTVTKSITVYARWTINNATPFTVTFNKNADEAVDASPITKTVTAPATTVGVLPTEPTRTGYTFAGWYTVQAATGGTEFTASTTVTASITVYARWTEVLAGAHIVTFDKNTDDFGSTDATPSSITVNPPATNVGALPSTEPTRTGYTFTGWFTTSGTKFEATTTVTGDITVYAQWIGDTYTVTFDKNGGDTEADPATKEVTVPDTNIDALPATEPTRTGYAFAGWYDADGFEFTVDTDVIGNITVYAQWTELLKYTVTFDKNGGDTEADPKTIDVTEPDTTVSALPSTEPTRTGYLFKGWFTASGATFTTSTTVTDDITVYAQWDQIVANAHIVTFDKNNNDEDSTDASPAIKQVVPPNEKIDALPSTEPTRTGYTFAGWYNTEAETGGTQFTANTPVTSSITVYARWMVTYTVTFNKNAADATDANPATKTVTAPKTTVETLPVAPARTGYTFAGWYNTEAETGGTQFQANTPVTSNTTVYARWTANIYTVTFNKNAADAVDANPTTKTVTVPATNVGTLPAEPTRTGYTFAGWYTVQAATGGTQFLGNTAVTSNTTVYARWTANIYTVTFNKNADDATNANPTTKTVTVPATTVGTLPAEPTRAGYTFAGWWDIQAVTGGTQFLGNTTVTSSTTVYARWTVIPPNSYIVTFNKNAADAVDANPTTKTVTAPKTTVETLPTEPTRTGYTFAGWYTVQAVNGGTQFQANTPVTVNITVYARWTANTYTVTFDKNGGTTEANPATKTVTTPKTTVETLPTAPTRTGYTFADWWDVSETSGGNQFQANTPVTGNITVYARWTLNNATTYTVTFDKNDGTTEADPTTKTVTAPATDVGTLPTEPTKSGSIFTGWNTKADGTGTPFEASTIVASNITVYAQWKAAYKYTVTFDKNGGTTEANPSVKEVEEPATTINALPTAPAQTGYTFAGWYDTNSASGGNSFDASTTVTGNITVYARWTLNIYAVTFNKNAPAYANASEAVPASADGSINGTTLPATPPAYAAGWDAGVSFAGWYPNANGSGTEFTALTPVTETTTVYAKWTFNAGTPQVVGSTMVHNAPVTARTTSGGQGSWSGDENDDGSATYSGGAISYPFPSNYGDYDYVKIEYVSNGTMGVILKKGLTGTDYIPIRANGNPSTNQYPSLSASGSFEFNVVDAGTSSPGIAMQRNNGNATVKFTKVTFTQGNRHTITFDANHPAGESIPSIQLLEGATIPSLPTPAARSDGYTFIGWFDAADGGNAFTGSSPMPANNLTLYAQWSAPSVPRPDINVDFSSASLTAVGGLPSGNIGSPTSTSYTYTVNNWNQGVAFTIDIGTANLSDYDKIVFTVSGSGSDYANKPCSVAASQSAAPAYSQPGQNNAPLIVTPYVNGNNLGGTTAFPVTLAFNIDKSKTSSLTGEIWLGVFIHANNATYTISDFKIVQTKKVDFTSVTIAGAGNGTPTIDETTASSITYKTTSGYGQGIAFKVNIGTALLSEYDKISFTINSVGDANNKPCNVAYSTGANPPAYADAGSTNAVFITTKGNGNNIGSSHPVTLTFDIDKGKASSVTGEFWLAIFLHANPTTYTISNFELF